MTDTSVLGELIVGRVEPRIYAFTTNTVPNYLKVGDTYRPVDVRLDEWREHFPHLKREFDDSAKIGEVFRKTRTTCKGKVPGRLLFKRVL